MKTPLEYLVMRGLGTVGHTGTFALDASNALGESISTLVREIQPQQIGS
jgi:putative transposase